MRVVISPTRQPAHVRMLAAALAGLMVVSPLWPQGSGEAAHPSTHKTQPNARTKAHAGSTGRKAGSAAKRTRARTAARKKRAPSPRAQRIHQAFVASSELRPMAQQLATLRSPAAYAGVTSYARSHSGEAAAAAYLALGRAYLVDKKYADATASLRQARQAGDVLADYADFLSARSSFEAGNFAAAELILKGFTQRYPDSIFAPQAPELEANTLLGLNDAAGAQRVLAASASSAAAARPAFKLARAQTAMALGQTAEAVRDYKDLLLGHPLSSEAEAARARLTALGAETQLTVAELRSLGDAYYKAGRYGLAAEEYRALAGQARLDEQSRDSFAVAAAACDWKLKRLTVAEISALPDTPDDSGARRMYLLMELARDRGDTDEQKRLVTRMEATYPRSEWLAEALFSAGNMYLLRRDYPVAVEYYSYLAAHFPNSKNASAAHWRAGWLCYRQGLYSDAARLFDEQIRLYPTATDTVSALYWRARLYETQENKPALAAANYRAIVRAYQHFFYAQMARDRLAALGNPVPVADGNLDSFKAPEVPALDDSFPDDSVHLAKARLLANAGLNDYIPQEIAADPDSGSWSALAEAQIYASYGEYYRAMRALKRAMPYAASAPIKSIPLAYWRILFPEPYWSIIKSESAKNNLDPYLVASLIRQESEFNPSVVSYANAWGLMQLLPSVGKSMAREEGMAHFETYQLLDPATNIRLGTRYLREMLSRFGGVPEYALAAYNAGDSRVADWQAAGPYHGMDEFVESIPFTQTREYVQGILRNIETYRDIDAAYGAAGREAAGR